MVAKLLTWFEKNRRDLPWRKTRDLYALWVSEIMLQQTQVSTVIPYYNRFMETFPTLADLAVAEEDKVLKMWEGLGYYSRARNLHRAAKIIQSGHNLKIPEDSHKFQKLPGVGSYIAAAVLSIGLGIPIPAVDGNVMRVFCRFNMCDLDIRKTATKKWIESRLLLIIPIQNPGDFNQALMELGSQICRTKHPLCSSCPLNRKCRAYKKSKIDVYPIKSPKPDIPGYNVSVAVIVNGNRFYIQKRPSTGHLGGLWEFPGGKARPGETSEHAVVRECYEELKVELKVIRKLTVIRHAYTHFKINLTAFICKLAEGASIQTERSHRWISFDQIKNYPFPGANHKFFPVLQSYLKSTQS